MPFIGGSTVDPIGVDFLVTILGAALALNQSLYVVSEGEGSVEVCVDLEAKLRRTIQAEILVLQGLGESLLP